MCPRERRGTNDWVQCAVCECERKCSVCDISQCLSWEAARQCALAAPSQCSEPQPQHMLRDYHSATRRQAGREREKCVEHSEQGHTAGLQTCMCVHLSVKVRNLLVCMCFLVCRCVFLCTFLQEPSLPDYRCQHRYYPASGSCFSARPEKALLCTKVDVHTDARTHKHTSNQLIIQLWADFSNRKTQINLGKQKLHDFIFMPMVNSEINTQTNTPLYVQSEAPINWEERYKQLLVLRVERHVITGAQLLKRRRR